MVLKPVQVLPRDGYGWAEFIDADKSPGETTGERNQAPFYRRAGGLLALLHMLRATDFHHENVISSNGYPVPVDLESLLHPDIAKLAGGDPVDAARAAAASLLNESVLATLYLPTWMWSPGGRLDAIGGLDEPTDPRELWTRFQSVNSDAMTIAAPASGDESKAALQGAARVAVHFQDFVAGFSGLYAFLVRHRAALLAADGPLTPFRHVVVRVILKATRTYGLVQRRARSYQNLADGASWSLNFDFLCRGDLTNDPSPQTCAIAFAAEREALASV